MSKYTVEVISGKEVTRDLYYSSRSTETVNVKESDIYEAISKYLQVKGFDTEIVSVKSAQE